ncbi:ABC transporter substrate-binding protein [Kineococcus arenarius]|uniref:ABC transporter substrate-binding protein n=1 Tax=unclassified Kineococcus TaxID=2621656 RepID=UPI003D7D3E74
MTRALRTSAITALAATSLALTSCSGSALQQASGSSDASGEAVEEVVIGALHPLSGASAADGQAMEAAAQMAVEAVNDAGGIASLGGAELVLASADTQGKAEVGQSEATRLVQEGAAALIGTYQSAVSSNVASVAERNQVPFVIDVSNLDAILDQGYTYTFRIQPNASAMGAQGADSLIAMSAAAGTPVRKVAFLHEQGNFGQATLAAFEAEAEAQGVQVDPVISYDATSVSDMTTQLQQVAASGADVLAVAGYYRDSLLVSQAVQTIQPAGLNAVYGVANGAYDQPQFLTDAPAGGAGYFDANYHWDVSDPRAQELAARFEQEQGEPIRTSAVEAYDAVMLIADALQEAGSTDGAAVRDALRASDYDPLVVNDGPVSFGEDGENENAAIVVMQVQDGAVEQVFPEALAESAPVYPAPPVTP